MFSTSDWDCNSCSMFGAVIMRIVYDITVDREDDPYVATAEEAVRKASDATVPGAFLVDVLPIRACAAPAPTHR